MKRILRREFVIVGTVALGLLGWITVSAATGSLAGHHVTLLEASTHAQRASQSPIAEREAKQAPERVEAPEKEGEENEENAKQAPPSASPSPIASSRTFTLVGGTVTFACTGNSITLSSATPNAGFNLEIETEDGGQEIKVRFESDTHRSEVRATCVAGQVQANEIRERSR